MIKESNIYLTREPLEVIPTIRAHVLWIARGGHVYIWSVRVRAIAALFQSYERNNIIVDGATFSVLFVFRILAKTFLSAEHVIINFFSLVTIYIKNLCWILLSVRKKKDYFFNVLLNNVFYSFHEWTLGKIPLLFSFV